MTAKAANGNLSFEQLLEGSAGSMQGHDPARLMGFFAHEMQQFFMHMQARCRATC